MAIPIIGAAIGALIAGGSSLLAFGPGIGDYFTRTLNDTFQARIATTNDLINAFRRGKINKEDFKQLAHENGFDDKQIEILLDASKSVKNVGEILTLWFRYKDNPTTEFNVSRSWLTKEMKALGFAEADVKDIVEANRPVPSLQDIIRYSVRDVFEEQAVRLGRLDEGLPELFVQEAAKRGFAKQDAIFEWRSHWIFPSINQAFEMFHRLFDHPNPELRFTFQEMDTYFNVADIAPGMRERLKAIAYTPVGRVDIRRFDRMGIYGIGPGRKQKLIRAYQELGYSPENSALQADFTIQLNDRSRSPFSVARILKLFREGIPSDGPEDFARKQLRTRGLTTTQIDELIAIEKEQILSLDQQTKVNKIQDDFLNGVIVSETSLRDALNKLGLPSSKVKELFDAITKEEERSRRRPSIAKADQLLQSGIINEKEWRDIYEWNGYKRKDQNKLLQLTETEDSPRQRFPSKDDMVGFLETQLIDVETFRSIMREIGYEKRFVDLYLLSAGFPIEG